MVFKSLSYPKGEMVAQAPDSALPGARIPIEIRVTIEEEIKPRALRVELVGEETYYLPSRGRHSHGSVPWESTFAKIVQVVAEQPSLSQGMEQKWSCSVQIPPDALPSCRGEWVNIRWTLKAILDVHNRVDLMKANPLRVLSPSPQMGDVSLASAEKTFGQVVLTLKAPREISTGNTLKGQLALQIKDKLSVRSIRIELVRIEDAKEEKVSQVISTARVSEEASFNQVDSPSFEFALDVPAGAPPTSVCKHSYLRWKVRAVIDRNMKTDFNVEQDLIVYNAPKITDG
jgi:hypothetical protein